MELFDSFREPPKIREPHFEYPDDFVRDGAEAGDAEGGGRAAGLEKDGEAPDTHGYINPPEAILLPLLAIFVIALQPCSPPADEKPWSLLFEMLHEDFTWPMQETLGEVGSSASMATRAPPPVTPLIIFIIIPCCCCCCCCCKLLEKMESFLGVAPPFLAFIFFDPIWDNAPLVGSRAGLLSNGEETGAYQAGLSLAGVGIECRIQVYNGRIHTVPLDSPSSGHLCK
mgnify:CR=1 FL=1